MRVETGHLLDQLAAADRHPQQQAGRTVSITSSSSAMLVKIWVELAQNQKWWLLLLSCAVKTTEWKARTSETCANDVCM